MRVVFLSLNFFFFFFFYSYIFPLGFLLWEIQIQDAFLGESQLQQSRATQPMVLARCFNVSITHWSLRWNTGSLTCAQMLMHANAHGGVRTHVRESALNVDSERKSLAALGNQTCVSGVLVRRCTNFSIEKHCFTEPLIYHCVLQAAVSAHSSIEKLYYLEPLIYHCVLQVTVSHTAALSNSTILNLRFIYCVLQVAVLPHWSIEKLYWISNVSLCIADYSLRTQQHWVILLLFNLWSTTVHCSLKSHRTAPLRNHWTANLALCFAGCSLTTQQHWANPSTLPLTYHHLLLVAVSPHSNAEQIPLLSLCSSTVYCRLQSHHDAALNSSTIKPLIYPSVHIAGQPHLSQRSPAQPFWPHWDVHVQRLLWAARRASGATEPGHGRRGCGERQESGQRSGTVDWQLGAAVLGHQGNVLTRSTGHLCHRGLPKDTMEFAVTRPKIKHSDYWVEAAIWEMTLVMC